MSDLYQELILEHYKHPHHQGDLQGADRVSQETNASCGDSISVGVFWSAASTGSRGTAPLADLKWQGQGCAISMATMSLLANTILEQHLTPIQIAALTDADLLELLGLEAINPGREKCMQLGLRAVKKTLQN